MEYRRLGGAGVKVSLLSFGSWVTFGPQVDVGEAVQMMRTAYDAGVNFFDNAEAYAAGESERIMGAALEQLAWDRDSFLVSSKVMFGCHGKDNKPNQTGLSRKHVIEACHQAMQRLRVDYLDLYFCHRPDPSVPIEETVRAMETLIQQGKVLYWGTSEWSAQEIMEAWSIARQFNMTPPTMEQPQYNMLERDRFEKEYARLYSTIGLGTTIWSPLASGLLTGKYNDGIPDDSRVNLPGYEWLKQRFTGEWGKANLPRVRKLTELADGLGISLTHLALAWCAKNPNVSTIILGASRNEQLVDNLKSLDAVKLLNDDVMQRIEDILTSA